MTNEEAKKAGFRTASGALYVYWCIENGHIYVRSCDACALTGNDFPTRAKAREALRKRKAEAATKPSETPAEKDARIKALVDGYITKGGPITKEQLTDEVFTWLQAQSANYFGSRWQESTNGLPSYRCLAHPTFRFWGGMRWPSEKMVEERLVFWCRADAEHAKWLTDMQSQTTPITPEQAKMLRDGDSFYLLDSISLDGIAKVTWTHINEARKVEAIGGYFTRAAEEAALDKAKPCDMSDDMFLNGMKCRRLPDNEPHAAGDIPVDGSQTKRFGSVWYRPVESHETPVGETQDNEVVTDETQDKEPVKWTTYDESDTLDCNLITPEWRAWKARQDDEVHRKETFIRNYCQPMHEYEESKAQQAKEVVKTQSKVGNKYHRTIHSVSEGSLVVDVYNVLEAFGVTCPACQHAIKKLLCSGLRNKGSRLQDLTEAAESTSRAVTLEKQREQ